MYSAGFDQNYFLLEIAQPVSRRCRISQISPHFFKTSEKGQNSIVRMCIFTTVLVGKGYTTYYKGK